MKALAALTGSTSLGTKVPCVYLLTKAAKSSGEAKPPCALQNACKLSVDGAALWKEGSRLANPSLCSDEVVFKAASWMLHEDGITKKQIFVD